jgi:hypothetical protein
MDAPLLTDDFREFLRLLNANRVDYLLVGGYAVGLDGYPRATVDLDISACRSRSFRCPTSRSTSARSDATRTSPISTSCRK